MALAAFGLRLILAGLFGFAAVAKLRDRAAFGQTLLSLDVPAWARALLALAVPGLELAAAALLLPRVTAPVGAAVTAGLLVVFSLVAIVVLARQIDVDCACFGGASAEPIGTHTLLRNTVLLLASLAVFTIEGNRQVLLQDRSTNENVLGASVVALVCALVYSAWDAARLRKTNRALTIRIEVSRAQLASRPTQPPSSLAPLDESQGLEPGSPAPDFDLPRLEGDRHSLRSLLAPGRPVLLIFVSAHCAACHELWPSIERWQRDGAGDFTVAAVAAGSEQSLEMKLMGHEVANVLLEGPARIGESYAVSLRPAAVLVAPDGTIAGRTVTGVGNVRAFVDRLRGNADPRAAIVHSEG